MSEKAEWFGVVNAILENKNDVFDERTYDVFMVNRALSQQLDCVLYADEMNTMPWLDARMHFDYLLHAIPARNRSYRKWPKRHVHEDILAIAKWFKVNLRRAEEIIDVLGNEKVKSIVEQVQRFNNV